MCTAVAIAAIFGAITLVLWSGAHDVIAGRMTAGALGQFVLYALIGGGSVGALAEVWNELQRAAGGMGRIDELLREAPAIVPPAHPAALPRPLRGEITLEHVTFHYPARPDAPALEDFSLEVRPGETVALVGPSGAGKSTRRHVPGGRDRPEAGEVRVDGQPLYGVSPRLRTAVRAAKIGFVFQSYHLLPEMDVTENVMLPAMAGAQKLTRAQMRQRALALLDQVGLADRATHMPLELSGGEQQRVALARALVHEPALILADEPTGNLDRMTGAQIMELLFGLSCSRELAVVMVTHSAETAALCDRVMELRDGLLVPRA
jgi:ATP-binding cassette subfamily B protein